MLPCIYLCLWLSWAWNCTDADRSVSNYLHIYRMACFCFRSLSPTISSVMSLYHLHYNVLQTGWLYTLHFHSCSRQILIHSTLWFLKSERYIFYRKIRDRYWGKKDLSLSFTPFLVLMHKIPRYFQHEVPTLISRRRYFIIQIIPGFLPCQGIVRYQWQGIGIQSLKACTVSTKTWWEREVLTL